MSETGELVFGNPGDDSFSREMYFPTMVFRTICAGHDALNTHLLGLIYAERERDRKGVVRSNVSGLGGWHSRVRLLADPDFRPVTERIDQAGRRISHVLGYDRKVRLGIGTMWSIINPPGSSNRTHVHPGCQWSGVYYVQAPENAGDIEFTDPRTPHVMNQPRFEPGRKRSVENWTEVRFSPGPGQMLLFPSWLHHGVEPTLSDRAGTEGDRVIVSFNLSQSRR